ncbi:4Fe-4S binding protein [Massilibacteroides sp.]|uniref:4Fe-4S binding protein n=1 Tax=Massilibacteroides sp. TaxID=2034766 RepID=UPI00261D50AF|nr:4Fe-4S binding protein [Massilibacteroides sp.]MDD4516529.1 4Fe-4S binding protein [Massilibacteroides sp.]
MRPSQITFAYFSATNTTQQIIRTIVKQFDSPATEYNITQNTPEEDVLVENDKLFVVGMPVYAGRIPAISLKALNRFKGNNTPAVIVCVYGNRDYDDALLELKDSVTNNGFCIVSAGAFIAQHSIFPKVGENRPDEKDIYKMTEFGKQTAHFLESLVDLSVLKGIHVKGNTPYKTPGKIPLQPKGDKKCNECGTCVKQCPAHAIPEKTPRITDKEKCISCGRCIVVCPQKARSFDGLLYKVAAEKFIRTNFNRKEPWVIFNSLV